MLYYVVAIVKPEYRSIEPPGEEAASALELLIAVDSGLRRIEELRISMAAALFPCLQS
jgi:hypothetical protein